MRLAQDPRIAHLLLFQLLPIPNPTFEAFHKVLLTNSYAFRKTILAGPR